MRIRQTELHTITNKAALTLIVLLMTVCTGACGKTKQTREPDKVAEIEKSETIPPEIKKIVRAVAENDSVTFAQMTSYPIERPYPLHDIENETEMRQQYGRVVDDSLRKAIRGSGPEQWHEHGWRGWTLRDGQYFYIDGKIYEINYISAADGRARDSLAGEEISSLHPSLRGDWIPVMCLTGDDKETGKHKVYRIDARRRKKDRTSVDEKSDQEVRLSVYEKEPGRGRKPERVFSGLEHHEGTEGSQVFIFIGENGDEISYDANQTDDEPPAIYVRDRKGNERKIEVSKTYWLDLLKNK